MQWYFIKKKKKKKYIDIFWGGGTGGGVGRDGRNQSTKNSFRFPRKIYIKEKESC